jgi:hypothetical protein
MAKAERAQHYRSDNMRTKTGIVTKGYDKRISDHVAIALVIYTLLLIFVVAPTIEGAGAAIWPYFFLVVLVAAVIPPFRSIDTRWQTLAHSELSRAGLETRFAIDRLKLWIIAIGVPFGLAAICRMLISAF